MTLTKDLEREFQQELKQYEEEKKMPYITSIERTGEKRGELKGELKGKQKLVIKLLNQRFGEIEQSLIQKIRELPGRQLEELTDVWLTLANVTELERWLQNRLKPVEKE